MVSLDEIKNSNSIELYLLLIMGALAFYLALTLTEAVQESVNFFTPDDPLVSAWLSFAVSIIVISIAIIFLMDYFH
jgi:hypothetical protein